MPATGLGQEGPAETEEPAPIEDETAESETPTVTEEIEDELDKAPDATEEVPTPLPGTVAVPISAREMGPRRYTVQKGDTLWDISNSFLSDSFLWPKVWKNNPAIANPDLIYPGNVIIFPGEEIAPPPMPLVEAPVAPPAPPRIAAPAPVEVVKGTPPEIPEEPAEVPRGPDLGLLATSGYILTGERGLGTVVGARDNRKIMGEGETIYLLPGRGVALEAGDQFTLYRIVRKVYHPKSRKYVGDLIRILGFIDVTEKNPNEKTVSARVLTSFDFIREGDLFMPVKLPEDALEPIDTPAAAPPDGLRGFIVEVKEDRNAQAQFDVVYLDRGRQDGLRTGDRFTVIREGEKTSLFSPGKGVRFPRRVIGRLQVIAVQDITATAKIIESTEVIHRGDRFEAPGSP